MSNRSPFFHTVDQHNILSIVPRNCCAIVHVTGAYNDPRYETVAIVTHGTLNTEGVLAYRDYVASWNKSSARMQNGADYAVLSRNDGNKVYMIKRGEDTVYTSKYTGRSTYTTEQFYPF